MNYKDARKLCDTEGLVVFPISYFVISKPIIKNRKQISQNEYKTIDSM